MTTAEIISGIEGIEEDMAALDLMVASLRQRCYNLKEKLGGVSTQPNAPRGLSGDVKARLLANHAKQLNKSVARINGTKPVEESKFGT